MSITYDMTIPIQGSLTVRMLDGGLNGYRTAKDSADALAESAHVNGGANVYVLSHSRSLKRSGAGHVYDAFNSVLRPSPVISQEWDHHLSAWTRRLMRWTMSTGLA